MGLDWFSVATEASGGGTPDLLCSRMFLGYMEIYRQKKYVKGATRVPRGWRARPLPRGLLEASLSCTSSLLGFFSSKNGFREVLGQLDSVWFSFSAIF